MQKRIIVGISGASGIIYGVRALQLLRECGVEAHRVMSRSAELALHHELDMSLAGVHALASREHPVKNAGAAIAIGSFVTARLLVAPCSVRSMGEIATGVTSTLLTRRTSLDEVVTRSVGRALELFGLPLEQVVRWQGSP